MKQYNREIILNIGCSWSKKVPPTLVTTKPIDALYPAPDNKKNYCAIATFDNNLKFDVFSMLSQQSHSIGLTWLLSPEPLLPPSIEIEDIIRSSEFKKATDREQ